jgi:hypothetical protein
MTIPVWFQDWYNNGSGGIAAAAQTYIDRVEADGGAVESIGCVPSAVWDWTAPSFIGLLDLFPNAAAAYSLRKLRAAYSGNAIRVRKEVSAVSSETDIGFLADGSLDTASLLAFASDADSGDVFVVTWYDQSTNGNYATQGTGVNQPKIVSSGAVITEGTSAKPAIDFDGVNDELVIADSQSKFNQLHNGSNSTIIAVSTFSANARILGNDASSSSNIGFDLGYTADIAHFIREGSGAPSRPVVNIGGGVYSTNTQYLLFVDVDADNATAANRSSIYIDSGTAIKNNTSTASPSASDATFDLSIGSAGDNILNNNGKTQEIILYPSDQSSNRTAIETNINTFYSIYP